MQKLFPLLQGKGLQLINGQDCPLAIAEVMSGEDDLSLRDESLHNQFLLSWELRALLDPDVWVKALVTRVTVVILQGELARWLGAC